jgi:hypothetical protein
MAPARSRWREAVVKGTRELERGDNGGGREREREGTNRGLGLGRLGQGTVDGGSKT